MNILGLHGGFSLNQHDPAAALIIDGELIACVEEERLYRIKTPRGFLPIEGIKAVLKQADLTINDIDLVSHPGETYDDAPKRIQKYLVHHFGYAPPVRMINHQTAHLASAFFHSGFEKAMCLSYDAIGDRISAALATGSREDGINVLETRGLEASIGMFYATMTSFLGFQPGEDEYKVMGLAAYGQPKYDLSPFLTAASDGPCLNLDYLHNEISSLSVFEPFYGEKLCELAGPPRLKDAPVTERHRNIAASTQRAMEEAAIALITHLHGLTGESKLCLAGGVALNCSANNRLRKLPFLGDLFVQPAASDRGLAFGCALMAAFDENEDLKPIRHVFYGPSRSEDEMKAAFAVTGIDAVEVADPAVTAAEMIADGNIVGWFQGRSEFGPRALGHRSILANPTLPKMRDEINARVKFREEFRPFAPSVIEERADEIFHMPGPLPYMTVAVDVRDGWGERLPSITHVNGTARVQTVNAHVDALYHRLIEATGDRTGVPVVLNTSFNIKGQPIVERPIEALSTLFGTGMDAMVMGPFLIRKTTKAGRV